MEAIVGPTATGRLTGVQGAPGGVRPGMLGTLERSRVIDAIGSDAVFPHEGEMLASTRRATEFANSLAAQSPLPPAS